MKISSESGTFICNSNISGLGVTLMEFIPNPENIVEKQNNTLVVKSLIIPKGINHFCDECLRGITVIDKLELPETIKSIGNIDWEHSHGCVFANSDLPEVLIPQSVETIGIFAFGNSKIKKLVLPRGIVSEYARQFKDSHIEILSVSYDEWENSNSKTYIKNFFMHVSYDKLELY